MRPPARRDCAQAPPPGRAPPIRRTSVAPRRAGRARTRARRRVSAQRRALGDGRETRAARDGGRGGRACRFASRFDGRRFAGRARWFAGGPRAAMHRRAMRAPVRWGSTGKLVRATARGSPAGRAGSRLASTGCGATAGAGRAGSTGKLVRAIAGGSPECSAWRAGRATSRCSPAVGGCVTSPPVACGRCGPPPRRATSVDGSVPSGAGSPGAAPERAGVAAGSALTDGAGRSLISALRGAVDSG